MSLPESAIDSQSAEPPDQIVASVLCAWKRDIDLHRPTDVATHFTSDALFQGSHPKHSFGRQSIKEYYAEQPAGLTVDYEIEHIRTLAPGIISAYVDPTFTRPDGEILRFHLTVILQRQLDGEWLICHYHVGLVT
jgi:uncharacterized protein (TIGR02246 family)